MHAGEVRVAFRFRIMDDHITAISSPIALRSRNRSSSVSEKFRSACYLELFVSRLSSVRSLALSCY